MRTAAILPVKRLTLAKQRLSGDLASQPRSALARAMIGDVLDALAECRSIERTIVVTNERSVATAARGGGATVVPDSAEAGQSAAVGIGVARALREGFQRVLCVPGDCPMLEPLEIDALLNAEDPDRAHASVVIVPDRHGTGTNGLLLSPPDAIAASFGPGSFDRHCRLAESGGVRLHVRHPPSLLLDVDTSEDLAALRARLAGCAPRAARTRGVLSGDPQPRAACATTA